MIQKSQANFRPLNNRKSIDRLAGLNQPQEMKCTI